MTPDCAPSGAISIRSGRNYLGGVRRVGKARADASTPTTVACSRNGFVSSYSDTQLPPLSLARASAAAASNKRASAETKAFISAIPNEIVIDGRMH